MPVDSYKRCRSFMVFLDKNFQYDFMKDNREEDDFGDTGTNVSALSQSRTPMFTDAINAGDRVDSVLKDMVIVMNQLSRYKEDIEAIKLIKDCCSDQIREFLDYMLVDTRQKIHMGFCFWLGFSRILCLLLLTSFMGDNNLVFGRERELHGNLGQ